MNWWDKIELWDQKLLIAINNFSNPFWDGVMLYLTNQYTWVPVYFLIIYFLYKKLGLRNTMITILGFALLVFFCDRISVLFYKEIFTRYRPCHNIWVQSQLRPILNFDGSVYCGGKYGFISSHATNFFGFASFTIIMLRPKYWIRIILVLWAALVAYTRMYLGVHYPLDILGGTLQGLCIGIALGKVIEYYFHRPKTELD